MPRGARRVHWARMSGMDVTSKASVRRFGPTTYRSGAARPSRSVGMPRPSGSSRRIFRSCSARYSGPPERVGQGERLHGRPVAVHLPSRPEMAEEALPVPLGPRRPHVRHFGADGVDHQRIGPSCPRERRTASASRNVRPVSTTSTLSSGPTRSSGRAARSRRDRARARSARSPRDRPHRCPCSAQGRCCRHWAITSNATNSCTTRRLRGISVTG